MWLVVDKRDGTSRIHFTDGDARRDLVRIFNRNSAVEVYLDEDYTEDSDHAADNWSAIHKGYSGDCWPEGTLLYTDDLDHCFTDVGGWTDILNRLFGGDSDNVRSTKEMSVQEYEHGKEPAKDEEEDEVLV